MPYDQTKKFLILNEREFGLSFLWPILGRRQDWNDIFSTQRINYIHNGIDIILPVNTPVYASESGQAKNKYAGYDKSFGQYVEIVHDAKDSKGNKIEAYTIYGHLNNYYDASTKKTTYTTTKETDSKNIIGTKISEDEVTSKTDRYVRKGEVIGRVGDTGGSAGNHLHFELSVKTDRTLGFEYLADTMFDDFIKSTSFLHGDMLAWKIVFLINKEKIPCLMASFPNNSKINDPIYKIIPVGTKDIQQTIFRPDDHGVIGPFDLPYIGIIDNFGKPNFPKGISFKQLQDSFGMKKIQIDNDEIAFINISNIELDLSNNSINRLKICPGNNRQFEKTFDITFNPLFSKGEIIEPFIPSFLLTNGYINLPDFLTKHLIFKTIENKKDFISQNKYLPPVSSQLFVSLSLFSEKIGLGNLNYTNKEVNSNTSYIFFSATKNPKSIVIYPGKKTANIFYATFENQELYFSTSNVILDELIRTLGIYNSGCDRSKNDMTPEIKKRVADYLKDNYKRFEINIAYDKRNLPWMKIEDLEKIGIPKNSLIWLWDAQIKYSANKLKDKTLESERIGFLQNKFMIPINELFHINYPRNFKKDSGKDFIMLNYNPKIGTYKPQTLENLTIDPQITEKSSSGGGAGIGRGVTGRPGIDPIAIPNSSPPIETTPPPIFSTTSTDYLDIAISEFGDTDDSIMGDVLESIGEDDGDGRFACVPDLPATLQQATRELISSLGAEEFINTQRLI